MSSHRPLTDSEARQAVARFAADRGDSLAELSRVLGRNPAYLQQFVQRGSPRRLDEDDRLALARRWRIDERELGARDPWTPR